MKDYQVSRHNIDAFFEELVVELESNELLICSSQPAGTGKWGMSRLWRSWMSKTAEFMAKNGVKMPLMLKPDGSCYASRPFNAEDAHELFCRQWLGVDEAGTRLSSSLPSVACPCDMLLSFENCMKITTVKITSKNDTIRTFFFIAE